MLSRTCGLSILIAIAAAPACAKTDYRLGIVHGGHFELFEKAGIGWTRVDFTRNGIERQPGVFDWSQQDRQVAEAAKHGVKMLPILDYQAAWEDLENKGPATDEERASFARFAYETAKHFKGRIEAWELWNEPNIGFWKPEPNARDYALLLKAVYPEIKRADPEARVVGGSFAGTDPRFLREMCEHGAADYMDVLSVHPYRYGNNPEIKFGQRIEELREILADYGKPEMPIWITEIGWSSSGKGRSQADQADYFIRSYLTSLAAGIEVYMWFNFIDDPRYNAPVYPSGDQLVEKPVMRALRACTDLLAGAELVGTVPWWQDPEYGLIFRRGDEAILAAWRRYGEAQVRPPFRGEILDQYGTVSGRVSSDSRPELLVTEQVRYVRASWEEATGTRDTVAWLAGARVLPSVWAAAPGGDVELAVTVPRFGERATHVLWGVYPQYLPASQRLRRSELPVTRANPIRVPLHVPEKFGYLDLQVMVHLAYGSQTPWLSRAAPPATSVLATVSVHPPVKWSYHNEKAWYSSPAVGDVNGDGKQEVVIASGEQYALLCFSAQGKELWRLKAEEPISSSPALADLDGDGMLEALIGTNDKELWAVDYAGKTVWKAPLEGSVGDSAATAADLDGGGAPEVLVGAGSIVYCFDAKGKERWRYTMTPLRDQKEAPTCPAPLAVGDLDGDGKPNVIVPASDGSLRCLDNQGRELWRAIETDEPCRTGPVIGDLDGDGAAEILTVLDARTLYCLRGLDGQELWRFPAGDRVFTSVALGDINGDGKAEVVFGDYGERLYCLSNEGKLLWQWNAYGKIKTAPVLADVDGDGRIEVLIGDGEGWFSCLDDRGGLKWRFTTPATDEILESAAIADLDGDGKLEAVFGCKQGDLVCLSLPGALDPKRMPWPSRRQDPAGRAALPGR
jgi:outer membrane protein assembly factor BamB